jgi:TolB-like protein
VSVWSELKRRNVFRVGAAYAVGAWFVLQLLDVLGEILELPPWIGKLVLALVVIGFFLSLLFAWAFELTPEGIKPEREVDRSRPPAREKGKRLDRTIIVLLALVVAGFLFDEFYLEPRNEAGPSAADISESGALTSIAVLPFQDLSQGRDQGWFADGLAEEILTSLARIPALQVSSRTASFRYRDNDMPLAQIASELGVGHLLAGSVRSSSDRIRVSAELIRTGDGIQVWSENYDRAPADLISIQEDLARSIAEALQISLDPAALAAMADAGTQSTEAYQAYLRGIALEGGASTRPREEVLLEVRDRFEQAVAADPEFGDAWYRLANWWLYDLMPTNVFTGLSGLSVEAATETFNRVINEAIEHAADRADRDGYRAMKAEVAGHLREAVERYGAFVQARPHQVAGWSGLMNASLKASDDENLARALDWLRQHGKKDLNSAITYLGNAYQAEDPSQAADYGLERLRDWPDVQILLYQVHRTLLWAGRTGEAAVLLRRMDDNWGSKPLAELRQACAEGRADDAEAILQRPGPAVPGSSWIEFKILGRDEAATAAAAELAESEQPFQRSMLLTYRVFDPRPFPAVRDLLERENIQRPPPLEIPFRCRVL